MAKIELTVERDYCAGWGLAEAAREFIQNGLDAQDAGHPFRVDYDEGRQTLHLVSQGVVLPRRALLLGATTKRGAPNSRGVYGEGFKLGLLALARAGVPVCMRTGDEKWVPSVEHSGRFDADVLVIRQKPKAHAYRDSIEVEIGQVTAEQWKEIKAKFLTIEPPEKVVEAAAYGRILLDERHAGMVFVGSIFVEQIPDYRCGYDLLPSLVPLDRDRRMARRFDLEWTVARLWSAAVEAHPEHLDLFSALLQQNSPEVQGARWSSTMAGSVRKALAARMRVEYGDKMVAVADEAGAEQARSLGRRGVVLPEPLREALGEELSLAKVKEEIRAEVAREVGIEALTVDEAANWARVTAMVSRVRPDLKLSQFTVREFSDPSMEGLWKAGPVPEIQIARPVLGDFKRLLAAVVHEVAHDLSWAGDATVAFENSLQNLWCDLAISLIGKSEAEGGTSGRP